MAPRHSAVTLHHLLESYKGYISTHEKIQQKGICIVSICTLCHANVESLQHLFVSCAFTNQLWLEIMHLLGRSFYLNGSLACKLQLIWQASIVNIVWLVWKLRNASIFDGAEPHIHTTLHALWAITHKRTRLDMELYGTHVLKEKFFGSCL